MNIQKATDVRLKIQVYVNEDITVNYKENYSLSFITRVALILLFVSSFGAIQAQTNEDWFYEAEDFMDAGNFYKALDIYQDIIQHYPNNANINFKLGYCYLQTATEKAKATPYLEYASKHISQDYKDGSFAEESAPIEAMYYLGVAYHLNYRFDDAERVFINLKSQVSAEETTMLKEVDRHLAACQVARQLVKSPVEMTVSNLGNQINTTYSEHSPVISGDESTIIFTSKREGTTGGRQMDDGQYFEDIYISEKKNDVFQPARKISTNINTDGHEASIGLSFDGQSLLIYRDDNGDGNIYRSDKGVGGWSVPEKLPEPINSKSKESHASFTVDQKTIYFSSNRKGGYGGMDIYRVTKLPNGKWSKAQNLGPIINTAEDEEGPYFHPDGTTLFFSSKGHNTMGGFDIFISYVDETGNWSRPENVGYPINTPDDDVFYMPSVDGRRAYYSSYTNNSIGSYDLFRIDLAESHVRNQTVIKGIARHTNGDFLENPLITLFDTDDNVFGIYTPDPETKKFLIIVPRGRTFKVLIESSNYANYECIIHVPMLAYDQSKTVIMFNDIIEGGYQMDESIDKDELMAEKRTGSDVGMANSKNTVKLGTEETFDKDLNKTGVNRQLPSSIIEKPSASDSKTSAATFENKSQKKIDGFDNEKAEFNNEIVKDEPIEISPINTEPKTKSEKSGISDSNNTGTFGRGNGKVLISSIVLLFGAVLILFVARRKKRNKQQ